MTTDNENQYRMAKEGHERLVRWHNAQFRFQEAEARLKDAMRELKLSTQSLGEWVTPDDEKVGEVFNIWVGDGLLGVTVKAPHGTYQGEEPTYDVKWRSHPGAKTLMTLH